MIPEPDENGVYQPLPALRYLRESSKPVLKSLLTGQSLTNDEVDAFTNAIMIANSVIEP